MMHRLSSLPFPLVAAGGADWTVGDASAVVTASPKTDYFLDPGYTEVPDAYTRLNADTLLGELPAGDFVLTARVSVDFAADFDAGVLLLRRDDRHWAKLCFEYSREKEPLIVSVVARDHADDANAFAVEGRDFWLRIIRFGHIVAFQAGPDGAAWRMVRVFTFGADLPFTQVGFLAQSPNGDGCAVRFTDIHFTDELPEDVRAGA